MTISKALFSSQKDDWGTPLDLFKQLDKEFDFTLDAAANFTNSLCVDYLGPGSWHGEDALACSWLERQRVWCNPPYGRGVGRWVAKAISEAARGNLIVMLLPARTDTKWFHLASAFAEVRLIKGRLTFEGAPAAAPFPSLLLIFRPTVEGPYQWVVT